MNTPLSSVKGISVNLDSKGQNQMWKLGKQHGYIIVTDKKEVDVYEFPKINKFVCCDYPTYKMYNAPSKPKSVKL